MGGLQACMLDLCFLRRPRGVGLQACTQRTNAACNDKKSDDDGDDHDDDDDNIKQHKHESGYDSNEAEGRRQGD